MDEKIIALMGLDFGGFVSTVLATELVKKMDKENKFQKFYWVVPLVLSIGVAIATVSNPTGMTIAYKSFVNFLASVGTFTFGKKWSLYRRIFSIPEEKSENTTAVTPSTLTTPIPTEVTVANKE